MCRAAAAQPLFANSQQARETMARVLCWSGGSLCTHAGWVNAPLEVVILHRAVYIREMPTDFKTKRFGSIWMYSRYFDQYYLY